MADKAGQHTQAFYRWEDEQGQVHIVQSLDDVPPDARAKMTRVDLDPAEAVSRYPSEPGLKLPKVDWPSFGIGFGAALLLALILRLMPSSWRWLWRVVLVAGVVVLLSGLYLGAIRRVAGFEGGALAAPSAMLQDAKTAVEQMNAAQKRQDEEIRKIQAEGH